MTRSPAATVTPSSSRSSTFVGNAQFGDSEQTNADCSQGVKLRQVTKRYDRVLAVDSVTLDIAAGSYCCLLGPSGCGKTTTLRAIAGHEEISSGEIFIGDREVHDLPPAKRNTAMMFQSYALFPHKTVWENVEFGLKMRGMKHRDRATLVEDMLETVGLTQFANRRPQALSGGQQQRVALARALVTRPQVLLLDEPLSALDEALRVSLRSGLRKLQRQFGITFVHVTHNQDEAFSLSDRIVVMNRGRVEQVGTPQDIYHRPASQFVAQFVGDNAIFNGTVTQVIPSAETTLVELDVSGLGRIRCQGQGQLAPEIGSAAACSVRADLLQVVTGDRHCPNRVKARVTFVEFTGYVVRISLAIDPTGQDIVLKVRSAEKISRSLQEGQLLELGWAIDDCIFLPT
ncbi:MAG: ABC transporter ATP-binding protein [Cyanobacteria bacterium J06648_11]